MRKFSFSLLFLLLISACAYAQPKVQDAQLWENIVIEKNITPKFVVRVVQEARLTENMTSPTFNYFDMGGSYKFSKHVHFTLAYVWAEKKVYNDFWMPRHQAYAAMTLRKKWHGFVFSDRQMFQWEVKDIGRAEDGGVPDYYLRNKVTIRYDKSFTWAPYIASEIYFHVNSPEPYVRYHYDRFRCFAGLFYRTDKENEFEVYYMIENNFNQNHQTMKYVIGLGYTHSF